MRYLIVVPDDNRVLHMGTSVRYNEYNLPKLTLLDGYEVGFAFEVEVIEVADDAIPEDFARDKYLYVGGEFVLNPDYSDEPAPAPIGNNIFISDLEEAYIEGVNSIDDE